MIKGDIVASCVHLKDQTKYHEFAVRQVSKREHQKEQSNENTMP